MTVSIALMSRKQHVLHVLISLPPAPPPQPRTKSITKYFQTNTEGTYKNMTISMQGSSL